ncbi:MAG: NlpC/P60 family protein [Acidaminococcaceae bacterium]|nr:NlpC/P60 family protein [Acidaminococcaceae bacterium]
MSFTGIATAFASFERGDDGQEVIAIQKRLVELNYTISNIDGDFGPETEKAVKKFQLDRGLEVDGVVGPATYKALMNKEMPPNRSNNKVRSVLRAAYSVMGTPYVFGGTTPYGFDCSGFTQYSFARAGISLPRMADEQYYSGRKISINQLRPGDLVFFTTYEPGASHCGIYIGNGNFIHAGTSTGVTVASAFTGYWGARYYGACRVL